MEVDAVRAELGQLVTILTGEIVGRTGSPNGSRPGLPTVQRPNVKCWAGVGV